MGETWLETDKLENLSWNLHLSVQKTWGLERLGENLKRGPENVSEKPIRPIQKVGRHLYTSSGTDTAILNHAHSPMLTGLINKKDELLKKHDCRFWDVMQNSKIVVVFVWRLVFRWHHQILAERLRRLGIAQGVGYHRGSLLTDVACAPIKCGEHPNEPSWPYLPASQSLASDVDWPWNRIFSPNARLSKVRE